MKKFIFTFKKHLFSMPDENIYSKSLRRGMTFTALILPILILLSAGQAWAATHTLTEAMGTDWITPASFTPNAVAGDTIIIAADRVSGIKLQYFNGTADSPYIFANPSDAVVTLSGVAAQSQGIFVYGSDNFKILGNNYSSETYGIVIHGITNAKSGIRFWRCVDWEVGYIHIHDTSHGISQNANTDWYGSDDWTEEDSLGDCHMHHCLIEDTAGGYAEGTYFGRSSAGDYPKYNTLEINNCYIYRTGSDGIQAGETATWLKIHDNYLEDIGIQNDVGQNFGIAVSVEAVGVEVYNNKVIRSRHDGIEIRYDAEGVSIHDNVVWEAGYVGIKVCTRYGTPTVINNTVVGSSRHGITTATGDTGGEIRHNLLVANTRGGINSSYATQTDNRVASSTSIEYFTNAATGDFSLTAASPARDAGQGGGASPIDHTGATRPYSSTAADIGAYEFRPQTIILDPPTGVRLVRN